MDSGKKSEGSELMGQTGFSWIRWGSKRFWSRSACDLNSPNYHPGAHSSVSRLIAAVYERDPRFARKVIRNRIFTNEPLSESTWGTVRVAARRVDYEVEAVPEWDSSDEELSPRGESLDQVLSALVDKLGFAAHGLNNDEVWASLKRLRDSAIQLERQILALPVSAVLFDREGKLLSWGVNSAWDYRTQHAEVNLIHRWIREGRKGEPASLWVSRKSCKMCAGWIWDTWREKLLKASIQVYFQEPDEGPLARLTVLDPGSYEYQRARKELSRKERCTSKS